MDKSKDTLRIFRSVSYSAKKAERLQQAMSEYDPSVIGYRWDAAIPESGLSPAENMGMWSCGR